MLGVINVDVFGNLRSCRARSPMFAKPCLQGSFSLANVHRIAFFTFDLIYWPHHTLFTHGILRFHQQLSQCVCWFETCWDAIFSEDSSHLFWESFHIRDHDRNFLWFLFRWCFDCFTWCFHTSFLNHCYFLLLSRSKSILGSHCISILLLDGQVLNKFTGMS